MWTPTHVLVTVLKAKGLIEKGKGGNDAYCIIGLGKEKYLTSVKQKSNNPHWDEQAEFSLGEREDLKITVYHKSSIIDEFIGRVTINIQELSNDNVNTHTQFYKLQSKPDKDGSSSSKKQDKDRGQLEIRIDFLVKPKSGSIMDLSKSKDKSLSIRSLKDKSLSIKHSIGDKLQKALHIKSKSKFNGENQLAEQSKRMGGSKLDFLDGDDIGSLTSSYSSINGPALNRVHSIKQMNPKANYSPRSSIISENSTSFHERSIDASACADNISMNQEDSHHHLNKYKRTTSEISASIPQSSSTPAIARAQLSVAVVEKPSKKEAPVAPIVPITKIIVDAPKVDHKRQKTPPPAKPPRTQDLNDSFADAFQEQLNNDTSFTLTQLPPLPRSNSIRRPSGAASSFSLNRSNSSKLAIKKDTSFTYEDDDDDDDNDWASSDEEIVKKEIDSFQNRNQVHQPQSTNPFLSLDLFPIATALTHTSTTEINPFLFVSNTHNNNNNNNNPFLSEFKMSETIQEETHEIELEEDKPQVQEISTKPFSDMFTTNENQHSIDRVDENETFNKKQISVDNQRELLSRRASRSTSSSNTSRSESPIVQEKNDQSKTLKVDQIEMDEDNFDDYFLRLDNEDLNSFDLSLRKQEVNINEKKQEPIQKQQQEQQPKDKQDDDSTSLRQSERRRIVPNHDLTSDLNSDNDFNDSKSNANRRSNLSINFQPNYNNNAEIITSKKNQESEDDIKTPDIDMDYVFQENVRNLKQSNEMIKQQKQQQSGVLPDILNPKGSVDLSSTSSSTNNYAKQKFIDGLDGVKFSDIVVPESLKKQLEYFDREELLQLIAYQKKFLDDKESRIKDLDNYIDNLVFKVIEVQPSILMQAGALLSRK